MAALSLREAAEQAGASKVDIWRAIRAGELPAQRTDDGDFAIEPTDLFRVFELRRPEPAEPEAPASREHPAEPEAPGSPEPPRQAETSPKPATAAEKEMAAAFATLGAELRVLLGEARRDDELPQGDDPAEQPPAQSERRSWWRRHAG